MGQLKIRSGWVEFFRNNSELRRQVTIKVGLPIEVFDKIRGRVTPHRKRPARRVVSLWKAMANELPSK